jgi:hypothetical protein
LVHTWNHHRWCWRNGSWVIYDASPYFYGPDYYGSDYYGSDYYEPGYSSDYAAAPAPYTYSTSSVSIAAEVQRKLLLAGYDAGPVDGVMGAQTRTAIAAFQRDNNLAVTGDINSPLLEALGLQ